MNLLNVLPVGTVVKLKEADKKVVIMGILQQAEINNKTTFFDYIGVPYPEGYLGAKSTVLFQEKDIANINYIGFSDIERQDFISAIAQKVAEAQG